MRMFKRGTWAVLSCAIITAASAAEPRIGKFMSYEANGFTVITSRSPGQAKQVIEDLGKFRYTLEKSLGRRSTNTAIPTQIVIVSQADWSRYLEPRQNVAGWFQQGAFANYLTMNGDAERWIAISVIFHEYTHYYLSSQFAGEYPPWFNEGLAEVMAYAKFMDKGELKGMAVLQVPMDRLMEARDRDWIPFERMIKVDHDSPEYQSHKLSASFYAQAWLTVHYGLVENRAFGKQIIDYLNLLNTLVPQEEAAKKSFPDLAAADKLLRDYSRNPRLMSGAIRLGELPVVTLPAPKPVSETDALAIMINLMMETQMAPDRTRPLVEALLRREPQAARSHIFAARLALQDDDPAAFEKAVTAADAALAPDDWLQRRDLAGVLLASNTGYRALSAQPNADSERDLKRAFKWYAEGVAKNNEDIELLWGFGTAATRLNRDLVLAEKALTLAYHKAPSNATIAISLANLKRQQEDYEGMIRYLQDAERFSTNISMRQWATSTLAEVRKYVEERKANDEENRKQREAYEKQLADYEKKYGKQQKKKTGS